MARMTGPDCAVMCNLINIHTRWRGNGNGDRGGDPRTTIGRGGSGDGNERSSGDGTEDRIGEGKQRRISTRNRTRVVDAMWETGETWVSGKRKTL